MSSTYEPGLRVSEYVLEERVGAGTFGEIWQARHHIWEQERVAIKLPTEPEYVRYLQREGIVVHGLRHPNIVRVIGLDPYADVPYLIMELVRGPSLRQVIGEHPKGLAIDTAVTILRGILNAMATAHQSNVLHRDLKPGNVLLDLDGKSIDEITQTDVKVSDFGLGVGDPAALASIVQSASIDRESTLVGTLAYMAPELRDEGHQPDSRCDLYAIGVILFELLTGARPAGAELPSTLRADVPSALDEVFRKLYARHERRYESAQAVLDELDAHLSHAKSVPPPPPLPHALADHRARRSCSACGHVVEPYDQFCTQCGYQMVDVRRCPSCGGYPGWEDTFCIFCGVKLPLAQG
jgi:serine/threonine protein kinase